MSVNEGSASSVTISPVDETGVAMTPDSARYKVNDKIAGTELVAWTVIATPSTSMTVAIPASVNAIIDGSVKTEVKVVTAEMNYSTDSAFTEEHEYSVRNLQYFG